MFLQQLLNPKNNNLDLFRLGAALLVIYGHAPAFVANAPRGDFVARLLGFDYSGSLAVKFFFILSGLLVTSSLMAKPALIDFVAKRAARILPGLFVCLCVTVFVVGPAFTTLSIPAYFANSQVWSYLFHNTLLFNMEWSLPGVFADSKHGINGSLWTLPLEVICYLFLAAFYFAGMWRNQWLATAGLLAVVIVSFFLAASLPPLFANSREASFLPGCFALGGLFAIHQQTIKVDLRGAVALGLLCSLLWFTGLKQLVFYGFFFYTCLYVSSLPFVVTRLKLPADPSYGVYIYGFVIQQVLAHAFPAQGIYFNRLASAVVAFGVGMLSWYYVEKPAIQLMKRLLVFKDEWIARGKTAELPVLTQWQPNQLLQQKALVFVGFIAIAWLAHFIALYFIFPGYYRPLSFQHSDFYIPASFAFSPSDNVTFLNLLKWPRPLFMWYYKFSGFFGHAGSVAWVVLIVFINCALTAFILRRLLNIKLDWRFAAWFALYAFLLFSQPYFYTFYSQDIGSQLSYLLLAVGVAGVLLMADRHPAVIFSWMLVCATCAFLVKETYILSFGLLAFGWFIFYFKKNLAKALAPGLGIAIAGALCILVSALTKSIFVNLSARQGSDYEIHFSITSLIKELLRYTREGITPLLIIALGLIGYQLYRHQKKYFYYFLMCVLFAFAAWLPNAVLPNHHYEGYSFNGLYLCFASLFFITKYTQEKGQVTKAVWVIVALAVLSPLTSIKAYKGTRNTWVVAQEEIQTNMLAGFNKATAQLPAQATPINVLVTGITAPFHPFAFPESIRSFPGGERAHYHFVLMSEFYRNRTGKTMDLVTYVDETKKAEVQYQQEWRFNEKGELVEIVHNQPEQQAPVTQLP